MMRLFFADVCSWCFHPHVVCLRAGAMQRRAFSAPSTSQISLLCAMHGRPRQPKGVPIDPAKEEAKARKLQQFRQLSNVVLNGIRGGDGDVQSLLEQSAILLRKNPDLYTVWNYRRMCIGPLLKAGEDAGIAKSAAAKELSVTQAALLENPKSYSAWHHRLWTVRMGFSPLADELKVISRFLEADSRNFHAWQYRRSIVGLLGTPPEDELAFSRKLIDDNFSNYSAWHVRASQLAELHRSRQVVPFEDLLRQGPSGSEGTGAAQSRIPLAALGGEYDLVQQAFFTDPEDQSAYVYHRWLLSETAAHCSCKPGEEGSSAVTQEVMAVLQREEARCRELLDIEPDRGRCKWPLLTLAHVLGLQARLGGRSAADENIRAIYGQLTALDPMRKGFYAEAASLRF